MNNSNVPLISVLTPTWNRADYLRKVWIGLCSQNYTNLEWIIANDGSIDNTKDLIFDLAKKSNFKVRLINSSTRVGKAVMDNLLMKNSNGEFLLWNDSDDFLSPEAISQLVNAWNDIKDEDKKDFIGVMGLNKDISGLSQTFLNPSNKPYEDFSWDDLAEKKIGDGSILLRKELTLGKRFEEVDFLITEESLWKSVYSGKKIRVIYEYIKTMDRTAPESVSFGKKLRYSRGSLKAISIIENGEYFYKKNILNRIFIVINYWRFAVHSDVGFFKSFRDWSVVKKNPLYLFLIPAGLAYVVRDNLLNKVEKTHIDFDRALKNHNIDIFDLNFE